MVSSSKVASYCSDKWILDWFWVLKTGLNSLSSRRNSFVWTGTLRKSSWVICLQVPLVLITLIGSWFLDASLGENWFDYSFLRLPSFWPPISRSTRSLELIRGFCMLESLEWPEFGLCSGVVSDLSTWMTMRPSEQLSIILSMLAWAFLAMPSKYTFKLNWYWLWKLISMLKRSNRRRKSMNWPVEWLFIGISSIRRTRSLSTGIIMFAFEKRVTDVIMNEARVSLGWPNVMIKMQT